MNPEFTIKVEAIGQAGEIGRAGVTLNFDGRRFTLCEGDSLVISNFEIVSSEV